MGSYGIIDMCTNSKFYRLKGIVEIPILYYSWTRRGQVCRCEMRGKTEKNDARGNEGLRPLCTSGNFIPAVFTIRRLSFLSLKHTHMDVCPGRIGCG